MEKNICLPPFSPLFPSCLPHLITGFDLTLKDSACRHVGMTQGHSRHLL
jgi:hypothetical protein